MYIKKILILVVILISTISYSYSQYTLTESDNIKIDKAIIVVNNYIEKKGEKYRNIIINKINNILSRKDLSEKIILIFEKLKTGIKLEEENSIEIENNEVNYNKNTVKQYWIGLLNKVRKEDNLPEYIYDASLDYTAILWSKQALERGYIDHKVDSGDSYYDYSKKVIWMKQNGVICKNIYRVTFSESIAWGQFYCKDGECTQEIKDTMDKNYNFFMAEKGKDYSPHYDAIVNKYFTSMGLGLSIQDNGNNKYTLYLTNHYCTGNIK